MQVTTLEIAKKVLTTVDAGLVSGRGVPEPGKMCVEAAVCYAFGLPHGDNPPCVSPVLRQLKIALNDKGWSSNEARAHGLRRLALAQLGSAGELDEKEFINRIVGHAIRISVPQALRAAASIHPIKKHKDAMLAAAARCEAEGTLRAARAAYYAADAAYYAADAARAARAAARAADTAYVAADATRATRAAAAAYAAGAAAYAADAARAADTAYVARDKSLSDYAEAVVQILIAMKAPGCQWLYLTE